LPYAGPMSSSSLTTYMGTTGERPELDEETECAAAYAYSGAQAALDAIFSEARAMFSVPDKLLHQNGQPIDTLNAPYYTDWAAPPPVPTAFLFTPATTQTFGAAGSETNPSPWNINISHYPDSLKMAWRLTRNPLYLLAMLNSVFNWFMRNNWDYPEMFA